MAKERVVHIAFAILVVSGFFSLYPLSEISAATDPGGNDSKRTRSAANKGEIDKA